MSAEDPGIQDVRKGEGTPGRRLNGGKERPSGGKRKKQGKLRSHLNGKGARRP